MEDLYRLTEGGSELTFSAEDDIIYIYGEERGLKRVARINKILTFLYDNGMDHLFAIDDDDYESNPAQQVKLTPYKGVDQNKCPICFDDNMSNLVSTPCNHIFHSACVEEWLKTHSTCPLCRKKCN